MRHMTGVFRLRLVLLGILSGGALWAVYQAAFATAAYAHDCVATYGPNAYSYPGDNNGHGHYCGIRTPPPEKPAKPEKPTPAPPAPSPTPPASCQSGTHSHAYDNTWCHGNHTPQNNDCRTHRADGTHEARECPDDGPNEDPEGLDPDPGGGDDKDDSGRCPAGQHVHTYNDPNGWCHADHTAQNNDCRLHRADGTHEARECDSQEQDSGDDSGDDEDAPQNCGKTCSNYDPNGPAGYKYICTGPAGGGHTQQVYSNDPTCSSDDDTEFVNADGEEVDKWADYDCGGDPCENKDDYVRTHGAELDERDCGQGSTSTVCTDYGQRPVIGDSPACWVPTSETTGYWEKNDGGCAAIHCTNDAGEVIKGKFVAFGCSDDTAPDEGPPAPTVGPSPQSPMAPAPRPGTVVLSADCLSLVYRIQFTAYHAGWPDRAAEHRIAHRKTGDSSWNYLTADPYTAQTASFEIPAIAGEGIEVRVQGRVARYAQGQWSSWSGWSHWTMYTASCPAVGTPPAVVVPAGPSAPVGAAHYTFGRSYVWLDVLADDHNSASQRCVQNGVTASFCSADAGAMSLRVASTTPVQQPAYMKWTHSTKTQDRLGLAFQTPESWGPADSIVFDYCVTFTTDAYESCAQETLIHGGISEPRNLHQGKLIGPTWFTACFYVPELNGSPAAGDIRYELQVYLNGTWTAASRTYLTAYNASSLTSTMCTNGHRIEVGHSSGTVRWRARAINSFGSKSPWATHLAYTGPLDMICMSLPVISQRASAVQATFSSSVPAPQPGGYRHSVSIVTLPYAFGGQTHPKMAFSAAGSSRSWTLDESNSISAAEFSELIAGFVPQPGRYLSAIITRSAILGSHISPTYTYIGIFSLDPSDSSRLVYTDDSSGLPHPLHIGYDQDNNSCSGTDVVPDPQTPPPIHPPPAVDPPTDLPVPQEGYWVPGAV